MEKEIVTEPSSELLVAPRDESYALLPIDEGFDFRDIRRQVNETREDLAASDLYLVVFRSQRRPDADEQLLYEADELAHQEALNSPALIFYFKGKIDAAGNTISFCLWSSQEEAVNASMGPNHIGAVRLAGSMYNFYHLERYSVDPDGVVTELPRPNLGKLAVNN